MPIHLVICITHLYIFIISLQLLTFSFAKIETIQRNNDQTEPYAGKPIFIMSLFCGSPSTLKEELSTLYVCAALKYFGCSSSIFKEEATVFTSIALSLRLCCNLFRTMTVPSYFMYNVSAYHAWLNDWLLANGCLFSHSFLAGFIKKMQYERVYWQPK